MAFLAAAQDGNCKAYSLHWLFRCSGAMTNTLDPSQPFSLLISSNLERVEVPAHEFQYPARPNVCALGQRNKALIHHSLLLAAFAKRARDTPSALTNVPRGLRGATYAAALAMAGSLANPKRIAVEGRHLASSHFAFSLGNAPQRSAFLAAGA